MINKRLGLITMVAVVASSFFPLLNVEAMIANDLEIAPVCTETASTYQNFEHTSSAAVGMSFNGGDENQQPAAKSQLVKDCEADGAGYKKACEGRKCVGKGEDRWSCTDKNKPNVKVCCAATCTANPPNNVWKPRDPMCKEFPVGNGQTVDCTKVKW